MAPSAGVPGFPAPTLNSNDIYAWGFPIGGFIVGFTFISLVIKEKLFVSDAMVATLFGVILGPFVSNYFDPFHIQPEGTYLIIMYLYSEMLLVVQIIAAAISLDREFWNFHWRSFAILLGPVTFGMFVVTTLLVWGICGLPFLDSMIVGAACSPTDPVLANSIVKGRFADLHVSPTVRDLLSAESAANDGMGYPFLLLGVYLIRYYYAPTTNYSEPYPTRGAPGNETSVGNFVTPPNAHSPGNYESAGQAVLAWFLEVILYQICCAAILGFILGWAARKTLRFTESRGWIDKETMLGFAIALALFILGLGNVLNMSAFILAVVAGVVFSWDNFFYHQVQESHIQEVIDMLLTAVFFIFFGTCIPWSMMNTPELPIWKLFLLSLAVLAVRRLPVVVALYPTLRSLINHKEAYFVGYFGPIGVAAIWYMTLVRETCPESSPLIVPICFWMVLTSIVGHGLSVPFVHLSILTYSRSRDPALRGPRGPRGWRGGREGLVIGAPVFNGPVPTFSRRHSADMGRRGSMDAASEVRKSGEGANGSPDTFVEDDDTARSARSGANSNRFEVYGGRISVDSRRSGDLSDPGDADLADAELGMGIPIGPSLSLGSGLPLERQNTVKFVDSIRPSAPAVPGGILVFSPAEEAPNSQLSFRISRPRSASVGSASEEIVPPTVLGAGIPYQRYHSRAISFDIPLEGDSRGATGGRRGSRAPSGVSADYASDDEPTPAGTSVARNPRFARSLSVGGEAMQEKGLSSGWIKPFWKDWSWGRKGSNATGGSDPQAGQQPDRRSSNYSTSPGALQVYGGGERRDSTSMLPAVADPVIGSSGTPPPQPVPSPSILVPPRTSDTPVLGSGNST
ncbi:Sodium/hydrogen exchanger family-domain-containing protein [Hyaloraphidium curvatum]|nr:Sodium/hydrogen exchanger family-domain-containing protein [Hyaloraphidium curvatum]